uniref:Uncharacterized protein n=1 Tax=Arundo donax TaxID=35708 RepID=A0A0A9BK45_ARUDO
MSCRVSFCSTKPAPCLFG